MVFVVKVLCGGLVVALAAP
ncbi:hypothetical protein KO492_00150 [Celeribacter halophilus]|nr:hypothetical protein [Pacificibacter marinus]MBU2888098.1 hypothetical protein [Celeribacter halophilus]